VLVYKLIFSDLNTFGAKKISRDYGMLLRPGGEGVGVGGGAGVY
jgi:hypothetical protein